MRTIAGWGRTTASAGDRYARIAFDPDCGGSQQILKRAGGLSETGNDFHGPGW